MDVKKFDVYFSFTWLFFLSRTFYLIILYNYVGTTLSRHFTTNVRTTIISVKKSQLVASTLFALLVVPEVMRPGMYTVH